MATGFKPVSSAVDPYTDVLVGLDDTINVQHITV